MDKSRSPSRIDPRAKRKTIRASSEEPEEQRIQEDTSTVVSISQSAVRCSPETSTTTQQPAGEAAIQARRDQDRILALELLDLEWTSLSPEVQRAVVALLQTVTEGR
jgi:hypothetical protein